MRENCCPACKGTMTREGQTWYCPVCCEFIDNILENMDPPDDDHSDDMCPCGEVDCSRPTSHF